MRKFGPTSTGNDREMPPRLYFLRHGEALHNVSVEGRPEDHTIPDPILTAVGQLQALSVPSTYNAFFTAL